MSPDIWKKAPSPSSPDQPTLRVLVTGASKSGMEGEITGYCLDPEEKTLVFVKRFTSADRAGKVLQQLASFAGPVFEDVAPDDLSEFIALVDSRTSVRQCLLEDEAARKEQEAEAPGV